MIEQPDIGFLALVRAAYIQTYDRLDALYAARVFDKEFRELTDLADSLMCYLSYWEEL
jgi:hypothetical protein